LAQRLLEEPDERVRRALLRAAAWEGRRRFLPTMTRYFTEADRRQEQPPMCGSVWTFFSSPDEGLAALHLRPPENLGAAWARLKEFADSLQGTPAARRNGIVLLLLSAQNADASLDEDRTILGRVVDWLRREPDVVREEDLHLILGHWKVMDPDKVVHEPGAFLRRRNLPEILTKLKE